MGNRCAKGSFCIEGSSTEELCAAGTYNPNKGQYECYECPVGSYCPEGAVEPVICGIGYYCEAGTIGDLSTPGTPCEAGKYQPLEGSWYCLKCPPGYYCSGSAKNSITEADDWCDAGYMCFEGASIATPIGVSSGDKCGKGTYCNRGSAYENACPPGLACPSKGMQLTDAQDSSNFCAPGYYCLTGATTKEPVILNEGGGICPAGHYCPSPDPAESNLSGTQVPYPCAPGTYRASTGGSSITVDDVDGCSTCLEWYYCPDYGSTFYKACADGWFCEAGETTSMPVGKFCPIGHKCNLGRKT